METTLLTGKDDIFNTEYRLIRINAIELSNILKKTLSNKNIDYKESIIQDDEVVLRKNAYEYHNFILMEDNGEYFLLDGFRRLLWNSNIPDMDILVRVYDRRNMSDTNIIKMLIELNHQKFNGGLGLFFDRGFSLCMSMFFNINLKKITDSFNGYVRMKSYTYEYFGSFYDSNTSYISTYKQLTNDKFVSDMIFLTKLAESGIFIMDSNIGALVKVARNTKPDLIFDADNFISKILSNKEILNNINKQKSINDSRSEKIGNMLMTFYLNTLTNNEEKTYIEEKIHAEQILKDLTKNKKLVKYTNSSRITNTRKRDKNDELIEVKGIIEEIEEFYEKHNRFPSVKVLVMPLENSDIKYGLYENFKIDKIDYDASMKIGASMRSKGKTIVVTNSDGLKLDKKFFSSKYNDLNIVCILNDTYENRHKNINDAYLFIDEIK